MSKLMLTLMLTIQKNSSIPTQNLDFCIIITKLHFTGTSFSIFNYQNYNCKIYTNNLNTIYYHKKLQYKYK